MPRLTFRVVTMLSLALALIGSPQPPARNAAALGAAGLVKDINAGNVGNLRLAFTLALGGAGFYATEHLSTGNEPTIRYVTEPVTRGALTVYRRPPSYTESNGYRYQRPAGR